nr:hypothetical protein [uncultured Draconibacterium sp.]
MKLITKWTDFYNKINEYISLADQIVKKQNEIKSTAELEEIKKEEIHWRKECYDYMTISFDDEKNEFAEGFFHAHKQRYSMGNRQKDFASIKSDFLGDIKERKNTLKYYLKILSVSDVIIKSEEVDTNIRANYSSEEIMELVLNKLYDLYDDSYYSIGAILEGNGIKLKRRHEDIEIIKYLENRGYVNAVHTLGGSSAQLTTQGRRYVEEKRKMKSTNYNNINDSNSEINEKIDEIFEHLKKLGLGQEIIYEELEELKSLYGKLNKKNWGQILKGKLVDLGLSQVINADVMNFIYKELTHEILKLK